MRLRQTRIGASQGRPPPSPAKAERGESRAELARPDLGVAFAVAKAHRGILPDHTSPLVKRRPAGTSLDSALGLLPREGRS